MSKRLSLLVLAAAALLPPFLSQSAHAQRRDRLDDPYIAAKLQLGLGGSAEFSVSREGRTVAQESDIGVSFGAAGQYVHPLHKYFALGGALGFLTWQSSAGSDADGGRNFLFDLTAVPQGKFALLDNTLELYLGLPIGLGLDVLNEVNARSSVSFPAFGVGAGASVEGDTAIGFVIGVLFGVRYQLLDSLGLLVELGYVYRTFGHTITTNIGSGGLVAVRNESDVNVSFGQFALNLGVYF